MNAKPLVENKCGPCQGSVEALKGESICLYAKQISRNWKVINAHHLEKEVKFKNFADALVFVNKVGQLAESEKHHPDIRLSWGEVKVMLYTHKINGLYNRVDPNPVTNPV